MDRNSIFRISNYDEFKHAALKIFRIQAEKNPVYKEFLSHLNVSIQDVRSLREIPFLPIQFFKSHKVLSSGQNPEMVFESSGTTGSIPSRHYVADLDVYIQSFTEAFTRFYGNIKDWTILALLPSYLEREGSSLVFMAETLIKQSSSPLSGFYLHDFDTLTNTLKHLEKRGEKTLLLGVSYALIDLAEFIDKPLKNTVIMETGGMKGRRKEMIREALHAQLCDGFGVKAIHSEYGMTELLSQAYSKGQGIFQCPPWMQVLVRDPEDALTYQPVGRAGGINVIDLANIHSCSFIATQDLGKLHPDGTFEVLGRFDTSDIRGCNLMVQ